MGFLKWLGGLLKSPDAYYKDPLGYAGNQCAHGWIGLTFVAYLTLFVWWVTGEYPNQTHMAIAVTFIYLIAWEGTNWGGWDSVEDAFYIFLGTSFFIFIDMQFVLVRLVLIFICLTLFLMRGMYVRYVRAMQDD